MSNPTLTTGQRIRKYRAAAGLTQEALAHAAKVSLPTVNRLEADRHSARVDTLGRIAAALDVPLAALVPDTVETAEQAS